MSDDLISRQAAIDYFTLNVDWKDEEGCSVEDWDERRKIWADLVGEIPSAPTAEPRWIPVTERLPEENKPVLVTHHGKYQAFVSVDWIDPHTHEWNRTCNVTAWQFLPEPWKGEDDD